MKQPAELPPESVIAICDTREQTPWDLSPLQTQRGTLDVGDYSLAGLTDHVAVERKSLGDYISCCGNDRDRFERQLTRLRGMPHRLLVIEATWPDLESGKWRSRIRPSSVSGSTLGWMASGIPIWLAGNRETAQRGVARFLYLIARRRWREARHFQRVIEGGDCRNRNRNAAG